MSKVTTIITGADGKVTKVVTQRSGCGCLTVLAAIVVVFGPAAWFGVWAVPAYILLGVLALLAVVSRLIQKPRTSKRRAAPQPPPVPPPPGSIPWR